MSRLARVLVILVLLGVRTALALDPDRHITELAHRVWDRKSGVPADIYALAQTTDGYLWIGSLRGLYRFDGMQFQPFESVSAARLPSHEIRSLFAAPDGSLWIGYRKGGSSFLQAGQLINYNSGNGFPEGKVDGFARERNGKVWVACSGGLAYFEGDRWHTVSNDAHFPGSGAQAVFVDHLGALWVAGQHRIAVLNPGASKFELTDEPYNGQVNQLAESPDGTVWMAETTRAVRPLKRPGETVPFRGMSRLDCQNKFPDTWQTEPRCRRPDDLEVRVGAAAVLFDQNGSFWITSIGDGLRRAPYPSRLRKEPIGEFGNALEQFTSKDGLSADYVTAIAEDREGNIWVGTRDGIDQFRNGALAPITLSPAATRLSIVPDNDGYVVALDSSGNMFRFRDAHRVNKLGSRPSGMYWLYRDLFGSIWGSGNSGACRFVGSECATRLEAPGEKQQSWGYQQWRLAVDGNHRLWAYVAKEGLFAFENGRWSRFRGAPPGPTGAVPTPQYTDAVGRVWFGFQDGRLLTVTDGVVHVYSSEDGLTVGEIKAIASVGTHDWVGGEHGLALLRGRRFTPVVPYDTPAFGSVSGIVAADDGSLWLNEYRGVIRVSPSEVSAILQDSSHLAQYDVLNSVDGPPAATEQGVATTAIRGTDGRLWFTTTNGAAWVDPRQLHRNKLPPPVVIQSIVADGRTLSSSNKLELPARTTNLQIAYAGLSLSVPERVRYRYRLKGLDEQWQSAGIRRTAYYTRLPPGSYVFQVIASNDAGVWNKVGAELPIRIIPAWYQTWWFYSFCAFLLAAAMAVLYRLRVRQIAAAMKARFDERLAERTRLAREFHDTLLQTIQGSKLVADDALEGSTDLAGMRRAMERLSSWLTQATQEGRAALNALRTSTTLDNDLAEGLRSATEECVIYGTLDAVVSVNGEAREMHPIVRDEIYRIGYEAIRNACQHSKATRLEVALTYARDLTLVVSDDGQGMDSTTATRGTKGHYGIQGMRERAERIGAGLTIVSGERSGTEVRLVVPGRVIFRTPSSRAASFAARLRALFGR
jgi:signal transduction histidine kinase/ligand-binding sensor domain-containing protein